MHFHAPRETVEHPALLVAALQLHGMPLNMDEPHRACCSIDDIDIQLEVNPKRFRANLSFRTWDGSAVRCRFGQKLAELCSDKVMSADREKEIGNLLRAESQRRERVDALKERASAVLAEFHIVPIDAPVEAEIEFVMNNCGDKEELRRLIARVRDVQQRVLVSVNAQRFQEAADHCHERERLLDCLYDRCTA